MVLTVLEEKVRVLLVQVVVEEQMLMPQVIMEQQILVEEVVVQALIQLQMDQQEDQVL